MENLTNNKIYLNNKLILSKDLPQNIIIEFAGNNNKIYLNKFKGNGKLIIYMQANNSKFIIGKGNVINNDLVFSYWNTNSILTNKAIVKIGNGNFFNGEKIHIIAPLNKKLIIGDYNLFAGNITIWGRNDHIIYDKKSKERLNIDKNIIINNRNWICEFVKILPGAMIENNCIVALGTILNKQFKESNCLIAGIPGIIKRENVSWSRSSCINNIDYNNPINIKE
jgi:acetyltransferase-like isoleucine patch superfamily enzyme